MYFGPNVLVELVQSHKKNEKTHRFLRTVIPSFYKVESGFVPLL